MDMSVDVDPTDPKPKVKKPNEIAPAEPEVEPEVEPEPEKQEEQIIQYVEPPKRSKKSRVYPG